MFRKMYGLATKFIYRKGDILQPLENREIAIHGSAEVDELRHFPEIIKLIGE